MFDPIEIIFDIISAVVLQKELNRELTLEKFSRLRKYLDTEFIEEELSKKLDWVLIINLFNDEYQKLWNEFIIPQNFEELNNQKYIFKLLLIYFFEPHIIRDLMNVLRTFKQNDTVTESKLNHEIKNKLSKTLNDLFMIFHYELALVTLNEKNIPEILKGDFKKTKYLYEISKKSFLGKGFRKEEIESYESAIQKYNDAIKKGIKRSRKSIALQIARSELGYEHDIEKERYYKRLLNYWKKQKK